MLSKTPRSERGSASAERLIEGELLERRDPYRLTTDSINEVDAAPGNQVEPLVERLTAELRQIAAVLKRRKMVA